MAALAREVVGDFPGGISPGLEPAADEVPCLQNLFLPSVNLVSL